jgi:trans-aconitate methyltransferase
MESVVIQRQYDDVIATQYDQDPQSITGNSLDRALNHLESEGLLSDVLPAMQVLDIGMGTGMFLEKLRNRSHRVIEPWGIDISRQMAAIAHRKLPDLVSAIDDGANLDQHFCEERFNLVATHFVTGFVPIEHLAPRIFSKLTAGGVWSFVGGTTAGYRVLQRRAAHPLLKMLFGGKSPDMQGLICPNNVQEVVAIMEKNDFEVLTSETYEPELHFPHFRAFMEYGYHGGWLTPFIEEIGLQKTKRWQQAILNQLVFPVDDHHNIVLVLARRRT